MLESHRRVIDNHKTSHMSYPGLQRKVKSYQTIIENTHKYRQVWKDSLKDMIVENLEEMTRVVGLNASITVSDKLGNAEAIVLSMGKSASGIYAKVDEDTNKPLIKDFGSLVYQQLFNGKVQVVIFNPFIEGIGQPQPPQMIAIYRPEEIKPPYLERHMEEFISALTDWEDFDDDKPTNQIGFQMSNINLGKSDTE